MKRTLIAALAALMMLSFAGCNSSGNSNAQNSSAAGNVNETDAQNSSAAGNVNETDGQNSSAEGSVNETEAPAVARTLVGSWRHEMGYTYVFREDKTGEYLVDGNDEPFWAFTYETDGDKLTMYEDGSLLMETKYTIDGDTLIIEDSFGEKVYYTYKA